MLEATYFLLSLFPTDYSSPCLQRTYSHCHTLDQALDMVALWWYVLQTCLKRPAF